MAGDNSFASSGAAIINLYRTMFHYQKNHKYLVVFLLFGIFMGVAYECGVPLIFRWLFDVVLVNKDMASLTVASILLAINYVLLLISNVVQTFASAAISAKVVAMLRLQLFERLQRIRLERKEEDFEGQLLHCFTNDMATVENVSTYVMWACLYYLIMGVAGIVILVYFNWMLALSALILISMTLVLPRYFTKKSSRFLTIKRQMEGAIITNVQEAIALQDLIRLHRIKKYKRHQFIKKLKELVAFAYKYNLAAAFTSRSTTFSFNFIRILILTLGGYLVCKDLLTVGQLIGFIILLGNVSSAVNLLASLYPILDRSAISLANIESLIAAKTDQLERGGVQVSPLKENICFRDVNVRYGEHLVLHDLNFVIPAGKTVAIVGPSGAGKSSFIKLILRELAPTSGSISYDGLDYKKISTHSLYQQIGFVMQQPKLFETSILENIRMGKLDASREEIVIAAKKAGIHDDIMAMPEQYDTVMGKRNAGLSGGQCQRIAIARALLGQPSILCLDEITSGLDPLSGSIIEKELAEMKGKQTLIVVTHHLASVVNADNILVLEQGRLVEAGTHDELLESKGLYSRLWQKQNGFTYDTHKNEIKLIPEWLTRIPLFQFFDNPSLQALADEMHMERMDDNMIVFNQGDLGEKFYILVAGKVDVLITDHDGKETVLANLSEGDVFGELALLYNKPRNATVRTASVCIFLVLYKRSFISVIDKLPESQRQQFFMEAEARLASPKMI